jgi:hypothetical protein
MSLERVVSAVYRLRFYLGYTLERRLSSLALSKDREISDWKYLVSASPQTLVFIQTEYYLTLVVFEYIYVFYL